MALIMYQYRPYPNIKYTSTAVVAHHPKKKVLPLCRDRSAYKYGPLGERVGWLICQGCRMRGRGCIIGWGCWGWVGDASKQPSTMPDVAGGWSCSLLGASGGILGGKLYILGVAGYNRPIWDVLALQGEREEAGEHVYGPKLIKSLPN